MLDTPRGDEEVRLPGEIGWSEGWRIFRTALIWVLAAFLVFLLWELRFALLVAFGAILVASLLLAFAELMCEWLRLPRSASLLLATLLVLGALGVTVGLFGARLYSQFGDLLHNVQSGEVQLRMFFAGSGAPEVASKVAEKGSSMLTNFLTQALSLGLGFATALVVVVIAGIYLAAQPKLYRWGIAAVFHPLKRARVLEVIDLVERTVRLWILGQVVLMIITGLLTYFGLLIIGLPSPIALALIAGVAEIVPYLGPFIGAVPALLVALTLGFWPAVWTAGVYLVVHLIEGYIAAPLIERRFVTIPPALILLGLVAVELIFGTAGIVLAAPVTVVVFVLVKMFYVDDPLEQDASEKKSA
jgi:predicted PurR-regulated permease PerM